MQPSNTQFQPLTLALSMLKLMRPKQWVKNFFVFAPIIFASQFTQMLAVIDTVLAFILFSFTSSATYIFNDINDIEADKAHPKKKLTRPLAAGELSIRQAILLLLCLIGIIVSAFWWLPSVMPIIGGYLTLNLAYSLYLKHQPVWDIFTIASGFVLRVYAGAVAIDVPVSSWMFVTTFSLALFLASIKRRQELKSVGIDARKVLQVYSLPVIEKFAEMSATGALVFYSFFVMSQRPELVVTVPFVLFGLFRYWHITEESDVGESPTEALLSDTQLLAMVAGWCAASLWAVWPG